MINVDTFGELVELAVKKWDGLKSPKAVKSATKRERQGCADQWNRDEVYGTRTIEGHRHGQMGFSFIRKMRIAPCRLPQDENTSPIRGIFGEDKKGGDSISTRDHLDLHTAILARNQHSKYSLRGSWRQLHATRNHLGK